MNEYIQEKIIQTPEWETNLKLIFIDFGKVGKRGYFLDEKIKEFIKKVEKSAYNRGVEDSLKCVPEKQNKSFIESRHLANYDYRYYSGFADGHNENRQQTIDNISKLKTNK